MPLSRAAPRAGLASCFGQAASSGFPFHVGTRPRRRSQQRRQGGYRRNGRPPVACDSARSATAFCKKFVAGALTGKTRVPLWRSTFGGAWRRVADPLGNPQAPRVPPTPSLLRSTLIAAEESVKVVQARLWRSRHHDSRHQRPPLPRLRGADPGGPGVGSAWNWRALFAPFGSGAGTSSRSNV